MAGPRFFVSYSRSDDSQYLRDFIEQLRSEVRKRTAGPLESVAFFDRTSLEPGTEWNSDLVEALSTCQVFVPLYTPSFFRSVFCGREWRLFRERVETLAKASRAGRIVPVLWGAPSFYTPLPPMSASIQFDHASLGANYAERGLEQLLRLPKMFPDEGVNAVLQLANWIANAAVAEPTPERADRPDLNNADHDFPITPATPARVAGAPAAKGTSGGGPRYVQFLFVAATRDELARGDTPGRPVRTHLDSYDADGRQWKPYAPGAADEVERMAQLVAVNNNYIYELAPLEGDLATRLTEAEDANKIVAIIVDMWTLELTRYRTIMSKVNGTRVVNCVVLVPFNAVDQETTTHSERLTNTVKGALNRLYALNDPSLYPDIRSADDLRSKLAVALDAAKLRILNLGALKKPVIIEQSAPVVSNV